MSEICCSAALIRICSVWEISAPTPHIIERILVAVRIIIVQLPHIQTGIHIHPICRLGIHTQREIVLVENVRFYLKDTLLVLVPAAQHKTYLLTSSGELQVMALLRSPFLVHLLNRIPQTVEISDTIQNFKVLPHYHCIPPAVMGIVLLPS